MKGKYLTRSHAMRESTSPPPTPPRALESANDHKQQKDHTNSKEGNDNSNKKSQTQSESNRDNSPIIDVTNVIVNSSKQQHQQMHSNVALCNETEFPKLSPPKSKSGTNNVGTGGGSGNCSNSSVLNINCCNSQQYFNNPHASNNNNKKVNGDTVTVKETHTKNSNNENVSATKTYSQPQQQHLTTENALQKALNVFDNTQSTSMYNSPMNYQLHRNDISREQHKQSSFIVYDKENRCQRNDSQNSINSNDESHYEGYQQHQQHQSQQNHQRSVGGKKHRTNSNSKASKPRLRNTSNTNSSGGGGAGGNASNVGPAGVVASEVTSNTIDGSANNSNNTSGFISRENSNEQYTDYGGADLLSFFRETLNKNVKDRQFLLKIEKDLIEFVQERSRVEIRFPQASSYNRMLIHRTAAFFGMEHNVDAETQQCVIVAPTKSTRIPEIRFKTLVINNRDDSRKSILKRDTHSFDEARQSTYLYPDRSCMLDRKAKSFEEREEDYDRARSRIFNRSQDEPSIPGGYRDDDNNFSSNSSDQQQYRSSGKVSKVSNSTDNRSGVQKSNNNYSTYGASNQGETTVLRGDTTSCNKSIGTNSGNGTRVFSKQDSAVKPNTSWRLSPSNGVVYHYDSTNMPLAKALTSVTNVSNSVGNMFSSNQNNSPQQQISASNTLKKQYKPVQMKQQFNKLDSITTAATSSRSEYVAETSTQTMNIAEEGSSINDIDGDYQEVVSDLCYQDENHECGSSPNGCFSTTTTTSTKNYDRIEVQKFKNQATSPNIPTNEKHDIVKNEHLNQTPVSTTPIQQSNLLLSQTPQQSQIQHRETPLSSRSTPFSNSDTLTRRFSEEPKATSWTQSYNSDSSMSFQTATRPNSSSNNPYCTTTYQQGPDGSIYAVPQGMIYAYPQPVEGEFQGYFMPVFDPSQQRTDNGGLLQTGAQAVYPSGGTTAMVPVAAYPTAQFTTTNGAQIYPSQVIYSGEQFQPTSATLTATPPASTTTQLQQIPMTTYPIGYSFPYNGYWGQTMTYYVPQQAVPATSFITGAAPPPQAPGIVSHIAGGVSPAGLNGGNSAAGPSSNSSNTKSIVVGYAGNGSVPYSCHQNGSITTGYQTNVHAVGSGIGSSHNVGKTYYGTGRVKRPTISHFKTTAHNSSHQVLTAASLPTGVTTATYQLGRAVPTLTLGTSPQATKGAPTPADPNGGGGVPTTATMYTLSQHATIFPANMFQYTANTAGTSIVPQSASTNLGSQTSILQSSGNSHGHIAGGAISQESTASGAIHNPHQSNTVITSFYTTSHHHAPHTGMQSSSHAIYTPGPAAIPLVDQTTTNITQPTTANNATPCGERGIAVINAAGSSQSAPTTPHSMPSSSVIQHTQRAPVFSTPPIIHNNGSNFNSSNSTAQYHGNMEIFQQASLNTVGSHNSNSSQNVYILSSYEKRNTAGGKKPSYQSASMTRQNSNSGGSFNGNGKPYALLNNPNSNNDTRTSPSISSNSRPNSIKRGGGGIGNDKPQTVLLNEPPSFTGNACLQNTNTSSYQAIPNADAGTANIPTVNVSKPPIRLNTAAATFRQKLSTPTVSGCSAVEYRRNTISQHNSPATNSSKNSNENSSNNSPNSVHISSNAATPIASGCYTPAYMINPQNNCGELAPTLPSSLYITTASSRGPSHIPPQSNGASVPASAVINMPQQAATALIGGAAVAATAADVANAAVVAAAAASVAHHHQPLLGTYNPAASGMYLKYGHTYIAHPSVVLPNNGRSPSSDLRPPVAQMAGMYPTVNMMIPAQPRHSGRHPNPNYKGSRPR